jgi:hypothetical protein
MNELSNQIARTIMIGQIIDNMKDFNSEGATKCVIKRTLSIIIELYS